MLRVGILFIPRRGPLNGVVKLVSKPRPVGKMGVRLDEAVHVQRFVFRLTIALLRFRIPGMIIAEHIQGKYPALEVVEELVGNVDGDVLDARPQLLEQSLRAFPSPPPKRGHVHLHLLQQLQNLSLGLRLCDRPPDLPRELIELLGRVLEDAVDLGQGNRDAGAQSARESTLVYSLPERHPVRKPDAGLAHARQLQGQDHRAARRQRLHRIAAGAQQGQRREAALPLPLRAPVGVRVGDGGAGACVPRAVVAAQFEAPWVVGELLLLRWYVCLVLLSRKRGSSSR